MHPPPSGDLFILRLSWLGWCRMYLDVLCYILLYEGLSQVSHFLWLSSQGKPLWHPPVGWKVVSQLCRLRLPPCDQRRAWGGGGSGAPQPATKFLLGVTPLGWWHTGGLGRMADTHKLMPTCTGVTNQWEDTPGNENQAATVQAEGDLTQNLPGIPPYFPCCGGHTPNVAPPWKWTPDHWVDYLPARKN